MTDVTTDRDTEDKAALGPTPPLAREVLADPLADPLSVPFAEVPEARLTDAPVGELQPAEPPPPRERDNELLADPPDLEFRSRLDNARPHRRRRNMLYTLLAVMVFAGIVGVGWKVREDSRGKVHQFLLPAGTDLTTRPRTMEWTGGKARLGLNRELPGVMEISLPDRTLRLADGSDDAMVALEVVDGKTVRLEVTRGKVVEDLKPGATPLLSAD